MSTTQEQPPVPAEAPREPPAVACARCGTPLREDQEWCLNCGAAAATRIAAPSGWRAPLAIVGGVVAIALAGLVIAFLAISDDSDQLTKLAQATATATAPAAGATPAPTVTAPAPPPSASPAPGEAGADPEATVPPATAGEQPPVTDGTTPESEATPAPDSTTEPDSNIQPDDPANTRAPSAGGTVGTWPDGKEAYTVVLLSSKSRAGADKRAKELAASGVDVGVLESSDFKSLRGGYFVVFSGQYESRERAEQVSDKLAPKAAGAYVRRVTPR